jgi:hypothetical protein
MIRARTSRLKRLNIPFFFGSGCFREENLYKQYTDLFAVCHNLSQILRTEIFICGPLRTREIVNQYFQGAKLIVIESAMIAV